MPFSRLSAAALVAGSLINLRPAPAVAQQAAPSARPATPLSQSLVRVVPRIPDVIGKMIDSVITALAFTRLPIVRIDTVTSAQPRGRVVVQRPGRGTLVTATKAETLLVAMVARKLPPGAFVSPANGILVPPVRADTPITHVPVPRYTVVPDLFGRTVSLVSAALETSRLRLGRVVQDSSDQVTAGRVFHQDPPAGTRVGLGRAVDVWYSLGAHHTLDTVSVPSIEGRSIADARLILRRRNLSLGRVATEYRRGADGTIVHQEPHAGETAHPNDAVDATVALAPPLIPVPRVIGLSPGDARATIERAGLDVGAISIITRPGAAATIDSQRPAADARVEPHTLIDLVEADAPIVRRIVPNLTGKTQTDAERAIQADSLEVGTVVRPDDDSAAKVIAQDPPGGASVVFHSRVNFRMSARPEPAPTPPTPPPQRPDSFIRVPSVINFTLGDAERVLADAGFSHIGIHGDSATATAVVVAQSPRAGTLARPEALVSIATERLVTRRVPNLVGRRERDARAEAERDRFFMRVANQSRKFRLTEVVVSQTPVAGASGRGDQRIDVDLHIPLVPPVPAAIVLGVAGVAGETFRRRKKRVDDEQPDEREQHVNDNEFVLTDATPPPDMPTLASSDGDRLIRSMLEFEFSFEFDSPTWDVESPSNTLIISEKVRHG
jgi:beta-lactam-binding protein with PASTA domain